MDPFASLASALSAGGARYPVISLKSSRTEACALFVSSLGTRTSRPHLSRTLRPRTVGPLRAGRPRSQERLREVCLAKIPTAHTPRAADRDFPEIFPTCKLSP